MIDTIRRFPTLFGFFLFFSAGSFLAIQGYGITYQPSRSMPVGWYVTYPVYHPLQKGDTILFRPTSSVLHYMMQRGWIGAHTAMMKEIFAVPGDTVCIHQGMLYINGKSTTSVLTEYAPGKPLPQVLLCQHLPSGKYMAMSTYNAHSFDSRYFGPIDQESIIGKVSKL